MTKKRKTETYQEYRDRVINPISPSFCGAKWYNATIWLNSGTTASFFFFFSHIFFFVEEVLKNPKQYTLPAIKKWYVNKCLMAKDPKSVSIVGKLKILVPKMFTDRVYKSVIYTEDLQIKEAKNTLAR